MKCKERRRRKYPRAWQDWTHDFKITRQVSYRCAATCANGIKTCLNFFQLWWCTIKNQFLFLLFSIFLSHEMKKNHLIEFGHEKSRFVSIIGWRMTDDGQRGHPFKIKKRKKVDQDRSDLMSLLGSRLAEGFSKWLVVKEVGAAKHRGSIGASHPAAPGSILGVPKNFSD